MNDSLRIAVLLPCYNEEAAISQTIAGFRAALPSATIYVYDNNSRDRTVELAKSSGAIVRTERQQGKGHVVRHDIDVGIDVGEHAADNVALALLTLGPHDRA